MTTVGFFSVVRKPGETDLTVRARVRADLEALKRGHLPSLGSIDSGGGTDYPYRAQVSADSFAAAIATMVEEIDYSNFKNEVAVRQGNARAHIYSEVWGALHKLTQGSDPE